MQGRKRETTKKIRYEYEYVDCVGCKFIRPYNDFKGHGYCAEPHVKMIQVIETRKPCVWKQYNV